MMNFIAGLIISMMTIGGGVEADNAFICEVQPLEAHSMEQQGEFPEYVCVNIVDYTDFIVIEDEYGKILEGDIMAVAFDDELKMTSYINFTK